MTIVMGLDQHRAQITYDLLRQTNDKSLYDRHVIPGYGHIDCIFGKNAWQDIFPIVLFFGGAIMGMGVAVGWAIRELVTWVVHYKKGRAV